ncbi:MAG: CRISPR-associated protein Cas4 [Saprospiraceae bacterium]|nr:CRISPR-associated protein Cas4 [Saprospiraceae bacterium]
MKPTATLIAYFHTCHRKLWLHAHEIRMEHTSELVAEGKLIGETSYQRRSEKYTQIELEGVKIDFYDARTRTVHETKRGRAVERAHIAQVQYYLYRLRQHGITDAVGLIEYPDLRKTEHVAALTQEDMCRIQGWEDEVSKIIDLPHCPPIVQKSFCRNCSFHDLCYISEL